MAQRRYISRSRSKSISIDSALNSLGKSVAIDFLINHGIPIEEDWTMKKVLQFIKEEKNPETGKTYAEEALEIYSS